MAGRSRQLSSRADTRARSTAVVSEDRRSADLVPERQHPAERGEAGPLAPAGILARARHRTAPLLRMADQRGAEIQSCEKQRHSPADATRLVAGQQRVNNRRRCPCGFPQRTPPHSMPRPLKIASRRGPPSRPHAGAADRRRSLPTPARGRSRPQVPGAALPLRHGLAEDTADTDCAHAPEHVQQSAAGTNGHPLSRGHSSTAATCRCPPLRSFRARTKRCHLRCWRGLHAVECLLERP